MEKLLVTGIIIGLIAGVFFTSLIYKGKRSNQLKNQSVILLDKIKQVCKLITVEGEFSEIFTHRDEKSLFFKLVQLEKKALIIVQAKVFIGFDLTKITLDLKSENKTVKLSNFPNPTILSMETDLEYYDVQKGIINKFSESDLTELNKKAKEHIRKKALNSHLIKAAENQASETIVLIKQLIESVGWELESDFGNVLGNSKKVIKELK